jgi:hypothetical protein
MSQVSLLLKVRPWVTLAQLFLVLLELLLRKRMHLKQWAFALEKLQVKQPDLFGKS